MIEILRTIAGDGDLRNEGMSMNIATEQKADARQFAEFWRGKGYEKGQTQPFWLHLLRVLGVETPEAAIEFEDKAHIDATESDISEALAKYVPAISSAVGHRSVLDDDIENFDMNSPLFRNGWGRSNSPLGSAWLHSDIKNMAYFYIYTVFNGIAEEGGLQ